MKALFGIRKSEEKQKQPAQEGFSLIEILVSLAIFSVMILAAGGVLEKVLIDWNRQRNYIDCIQTGRSAMEFMTNELKTAQGIAYGSNGIFPYGTPHKAIYFMPGSYTACTNRVWYWVGDSNSDDTGTGDSTMLYRGIGCTLSDAYSARGEVASSVYNASSHDIFNYDSTNKVVSIELTFMPNPDIPEGSGNRAFTLQTKARPRN